MRRPSSYLPSLLLALACTQEASGDDLPPGAFTSGPDDDGNVEETTDPMEASTTDGPGSTSAPATGSETGPVELNHEEHIRPIWDANCTDSACHDADDPQAGLDMASDGVYERICDEDHDFSGLRYIDCEGFDPQQSYMFRKIEGTHDRGVSGGSGSIMPPTGQLDDATIETIETWIADGATP